MSAKRVFVQRPVGNGAGSYSDAERRARACDGAGDTMGTNALAIVAASEQRVVHGVDAGDLGRDRVMRDGVLAGASPDREARRGSARRGSSAAISASRSPVSNRKPFTPGAIICGNAPSRDGPRPRRGPSPPAA